ncbi:hypothetical protein AAHA92_08836 [Salvia divinorum]|uniref:Uncharacterized protein n=1 Tax=Salvia divinorum TaxID=28513 RepID=A0ABD1HQF5_SALDI
MEKKSGVIFTTTTIVTPFPYQQQRHTPPLSLSPLTLTQTSKRPFTSLPLSLSLIRALLPIHLLRLLPCLFLPSKLYASCLSSSSLRLRSLRCFAVSLWRP